MIKPERLEMIMKLFDEKAFYSVNEILDRTGITKSTLRRDLYELESMGRLARSRGGAYLPSSAAAMELPKTSDESSFTERKSSNREEKERISAAAMQFIQPGDTVILDCGTTTYELSRKIRDFPSPLMLATNDLVSATELSANPNLDIIVIGGQLRKQHYSMVGYFSDYTINQMHADTAFISTDAIDLTHGLMAFSMQEVTVKRSMIAAAREVIVLCDHTKFSSVAFVSICSLENVDRIITGRELDPAIVDRLESAGVSTMLV